MASPEPDFLQLLDGAHGWGDRENFAPRFQQAPPKFLATSPSYRCLLPLRSQQPGHANQARIRQRASALVKRRSTHELLVHRAVTSADATVDAIYHVAFALQTFGGRHLVAVAK